MTSDTERLIELASRPLADNAELHLASVALLQEKVAEHTASGEAVAAAIEALEQADKNPRRRHWRKGLYLAATAAVLATLVFASFQVYSTYQARRFFSAILSDEETAELLDRYTLGLSHDQKLLLFGKEGAANETERWKPLWESAPENPAFLAQYAAAYARDHEKFSTEILETVQRVDPNNGWYPALAAGWTVKDLVKAKPQTPKEKKQNKTTVWEINDKQKLEEALGLIHQAAEKTEFSSYQSALMKQRISLLPPRTDWTSQFPRACYVGTQKLLSLQLHKISKALSAGAQECAATKDVEGFRRIVGDWQKLGPAMIGNGDTLTDLLVAKSCITTPLKNFSETAHSLGLEEEAAHFTKLDEAFAAYNEARKSNHLDPGLEPRTSMMAGMMIPVMFGQVKAPPPLSDADLRPSRYAEHALFSRAATSCAWIVFVVFIVMAAVCRLFKSPLVRTLASRIADLLRGSDWLWIVLGGVLLPMLWYLFIVHLTPLSSREWSLSHSEMFLPMGQFVAMVVLIVVLPWVITEWRLGKRGKMFGLRGRFQWTGWLAAAWTATAIPAFGAAMLMSQPPSHDSWLIMTAVFFSVPALWLMGGFFLNVFGPNEESLRRATLAGLMVPAWTLGILAFTAWAPFLYALECHWMQQDRLLEISADAPPFTRYEYEVKQVLRAEILEIMNRKP